jgi:hypothetical protein
MFNLGKLGKRWKLIMVYVYAVIFSLSSFAVAEPLHEAAKEGDLAKVKSLIAEGSDVNVGDENGLTPLHLAAYRGHKDVAEVLIINGANVNAADKTDSTPLHLAANKGHKDVAELLILNGANANAVTTGKGWSGTKWTPLGYAIYKSRKDIAELLILNGADVNYADNDKRSTYLHLAAHTGIFLIITGWLFRWLNPTILLMYPILLILYYRLARREEKHVLKEYGEAYLKYKENTSMFFPIKFPSSRKEIAKQTRWVTK